MEATANATASMETRAAPWWLMLIDGFALVIVGGILLWGGLLQKVQTYHMVVVILGLWWLIRGIMDIVSLFVDHTAWGWKLFIGIVSIIAGSYILAYPVVSGVLLPQIFVFVLGFWGLVNGVILLLMAFRGGGWGAGILGVIEIVIGIWLMASYGVFGMGLAFLWTAAVFAVIGGIVLIVRAFQTRRA